MKHYIMPVTQAQIISVSQLMVGSATPDININYTPISGSDSEGIIFGG